MVTEEAEVQKVEEAQPQPEITQAQDDSAKKMADLERQLEEAKREAKSHQDFGRRTKLELDKQRGLDEKVERLETRFQVATDMLSELLDRDTEREPEEQPKQRRSEAYRERLKEPDTQSQERERQRLVRLATEADVQLKSVGLDMDKSPETKLAYALWRAGDIDGALDEVKKLVENKKTEAEKPKESPEQIAEKLAKEMFAKMLKEKGLDNVDDGVPSGGSQSWVDFEKGYIAGNVPVTVYEERARREGKI